MEVSSVKNWFFSLLIMSIPVIGFLALLYWAFFSDSTAEGKKNFAKAALLWQLVIIALIFFAGGFAAMGIMSSL